MAPSRSNGAPPPPKGKKWGHQHSIDAVHSSEEKPGYLSRSHEQDLRDAGASAAQIEELRGAVLGLYVRLQRQSATNDEKEVLAQTIKSFGGSAALLRKLANPPDKAHAGVAIRLEPTHWRQHPKDDAPAALLDAMATRAREELSALTKPARHKTGDPAPIGWIDDALRRGWGHAPQYGWAETYPDSLRPHMSDGSRFWKIVGICYEAAGYGEKFPERALQAYVRQQHARGKDIRADVAEAFRRTVERTKGSAED